MADEQKPEQKPAVLEPPKDIEELLKELPKVAPQTAPPLPRALADPAKPPTPPATLPTKPLTPLPPQASPLKPPLPSSPPRPPSSPPPSQSPTSRLSPAISQDDKLKSLVRTMGQDLEAAKKGIKPESKPFEIKPPPSSPKIAPPPPPLKMQEAPKVPEIKLDLSEKTKPMELPKAGPLPIPAPTQRKFALSPKFLIILLAIIVVFAGTWWFLNREPKEITVSTPTITPTPTPVFPGLTEIFGDAYPIVISSTDNFTASFNNSIKNVSPLLAGKFTALSATDENGRSYSLSEIFQELQINVPEGLLKNLDQNEWFLVAYGQQEMFNPKGLLTLGQAPKVKLGLIAKAADALSLRSSLNNWEATLADDLKNLFGVDSKKATSETFLDSIYGGTDIRYRNFPYADSSIDYAIVNLPQFNLDYFVLTNSRESIYSAIDFLRQQ